MSNDLIHEVEESIKQERLERLWKEYGGTLIAAAVLAVVLTAGITAYRSWNDRVNASQTTALIEALAQEDQVAAIDAIAGTLRPNQRGIAMVTAAGLLARDNKNEEALAHYRQTATDKNIPDVFRNLAQLMAVRLEWSMGNPDTNPKALIGALDEIIASDESPWRYHAHLQKAIILAHAYDNYSEARDHLAVITSAMDVPNSLQERASALAHIYSLKMASAETQTPPASEAPAATEVKEAAPEAGTENVKEEPEG